MHLYTLWQIKIIQHFKTAIKREKQLKQWHREWKINLIRELNPNMNDLAKDWN